MTTDLAAFGGSAAIALIATPLAIRVACRTGFYDVPREYRAHAAPTPFLGGAAVLTAFLAWTAITGLDDGKVLILVGCTLAMWVIGTIDDRRPVPPKWRILAGTCAAIALSAVGLGWDTGAGVTVNVPLTVLWTVGLVSAFNLMDNLDGACATVGSIAAAGIGVLAAIRGYSVAAVMAFGLSGACAGFLPWNLARPARIFLGDGGSMTIGFLVCALAMATARHSAAGNAGILVGAMLCGLAMLDTTLVSLSRVRRGVPIVTGGRDHLTHRLLLVMHSPRRVALALALAQANLCALAVAGYELGQEAVAAFAFGAFSAGVAAIFVLDTDRWRPPGIAFGADVADEQATEAPLGVDSG